jgi:hypothetical protein
MVKKAKKTAAKKANAKVKNGSRIVGEVVMAPLDSVKKNPWNPNRMTAFEKESLKHGFKKEGWFASHALTIWRTDEKGNLKMLIIDGEHRQAAGLELGMKEGPMVFLDGLTEAEAKMLTVKLDAKRGKFDHEDLSTLLLSVKDDLDLETRSLDLGIGDDLFANLLHEDAVDGDNVIGELPSGQTASVKMVQLFFQPEKHEEFSKLAKDLAVRFRTENVTDTVVEAVRRAHAATAAK